MQVVVCSFLKNEATLAADQIIKPKFGYRCIPCNIYFLYVYAKHNEKKPNPYPICRRSVKTELPTIRFSYSPALPLEHGGWFCEDMTQFVFTKECAYFKWSSSWEYWRQYLASKN